MMIAVVAVVTDTTATVTVVASKVVLTSHSILDSMLNLLVMLHKVAMTTRLRSMGNMEDSSSNQVSHSKADTTIHSKAATAIKAYLHNFLSHKEMGSRHSTLCQRYPSPLWLSPSRLHSPHLLTE